MVSVPEASSIVLENARAAGVTELPLDSVVGRVLAERVVADRDLPPVDRVTMDGIAISHAAWVRGVTAFIVAGVQAAGVPRGSVKDSDHCMEVMTGTALPSGTDTVIPYEEVGITAGIASVTASRVLQGQNIHRQGSDALLGAALLEPGVLISPAEVALLATVGKNVVKICAFPSTAIVSSGDELVAVDARPAAHQVRRSNTYAILSAMQRMGWAGNIFHMPDNKEEMTTQLDAILRTHDVVILSGGVSKGKFDHVPAALEANGIVKRFHRVNQRPGKPFWFGTSPDNQKTVFALPGNPVSTYLCFYRYVRPWMLQCLRADELPQYAILAEDFASPPGVTYFLQVSARNEEGRLMAYPDAGGGSGDLANLRDVTGFLEIPEMTTNAGKGEVFRYYPFRF